MVTNRKIFVCYLMANCRFSSLVRIRFSTLLETSFKGSRVGLLVAEYANEVDFSEQLLWRVKRYRQN
jgi:hypothetical protein